MVENIKEIIAQESRRLFNERGYQDVSMREIAAACGISVGNLTYYYPRKEDLLMLEHDGIMQTFLDEVMGEADELGGLQGYFTLECAFIHYILSDDAIGRLYRDVINIPSLRRRYCEAHYELYCRFVEPEEPERARLATAAMAGLEFELADEGYIMEDAPAVLGDILNARLLFEGLDPAEHAALVQDSVERGVELSRRIMQSS